MSLYMQILEKLEPDFSDTWAAHRKAIEEGYELHYEWFLMDIDPDPMSKERCKEVLRILDIWSYIVLSAEKNPTWTLLRTNALRFPGFDTSTEAKECSYVRYFIEDLSRYGELRRRANGDYTSLGAMMDGYRSMLQLWESKESKVRWEPSEFWVVELIKAGGFNHMLNT